MNPARKTTGWLWWGLTQPLAGIVADRVGAGRVVFVGVLLVAVGTAQVPYMHSTWGLVLAIGAALIRLPIREARSVPRPAVA